MKMIRTLQDRWRARSPKIFRTILKIALTVSGTALAIQTAMVSGGADVPEWWGTVYPYMIGVGAGAGAVAKLTKE